MKRKRAGAPTKASEAPQLVGDGVFVSNLPWSTTDGDLRKLFGKYGKVHAATVKKDRRGRSKGVGVVAMHESDASRAIRALDGRKLKGRPIQVRRTRDGRTPQR